MKYLDSYQRQKASHRRMSKRTNKRAIDYAHQYAPHRAYEIREHIDYCFTCVSKMLDIEQQIARILKDVYEFKVKEIAVIMQKTYGAIKHLIHNARKTMINIFDDSCAFVSHHECPDRFSGVGECLSWRGLEHRVFSFLDANSIIQVNSFETIPL